MFKLNRKLFPFETPLWVKSRKFNTLIDDWQLATHSQPHSSRHAHINDNQRPEYADYVIRSVQIGNSPQRSEVLVNYGRHGQS